MSYSVCKWRRRLQQSRNFRSLNWRQNDLAEYWYEFPGKQMHSIVDAFRNRGVFYERNGFSTIQTTYKSDVRHNAVDLLLSTVFTPAAHDHRNKYLAQFRATPEIRVQSLRTSPDKSGRARIFKRCSATRQRHLSDQLYRHPSRANYWKTLHVLQKPQQLNLAYFHLKQTRLRCRRT